MAARRLLTLLFCLLILLTLCLLLIPGSLCRVQTLYFCDSRATISCRTSCRACPSSAIHPCATACWSHSRALSVTDKTGTLSCFALSSTSRPKTVAFLTLLKTTRSFADGFFAFTKRTASSASHISAGEGEVTTRTISASRTAGFARGDTLHDQLQSNPCHSVPDV